MPCCYGWTGSSTSYELAARTDAIFTAIQVEMQVAKIKGAQIIIGDFNCEPEELITAKTFITKQGWTDLGAVSDRWGHANKEPTCKANQHGTPTRRDIAIANPEAMDAIQHSLQCPPHDKQLL